MVALVGFYAALTLVLAGHLGGGGHGREFLVEVHANRIYFLAGAVTGPLFGAFGAWIGRRHPSMVVHVVGGLMAGEILAVALAHAVAAWPPYIAECLIGVGVIVATVVGRRSHGPDLPAGL
jgi:hypothetical protein